MVLAKTYIGSEDPELNMVKTSSVVSEQFYQRSFDFNSPSSADGLALVAANHLSTPDFSQFELKQSPSFEVAEIVDRTQEVNEVEIDVRPLEAVSNTGYGMWNFSEKEKTKEEGVPLDHGNTIMDGISRMFPIYPSN